MSAVLAAVPAAMVPVTMVPTVAKPAMSEAEIDGRPWRTIGGWGINHRRRRIDYAWGALIGDHGRRLANRRRGSIDRCGDRIDRGRLIDHRGRGADHETRQWDTDSEAQTNPGLGSRSGSEKNSG
jgi:hypothetical protein